MAFTKGKSGNPDGRPKGSSNKATAELREWINVFLKDGYQGFLDRFERLDDAAYCTLYLKIVQLILPKPAPEQEDKERIEGIEWRIVYPDGRVEIKNDDDED